MVINIDIKIDNNYIFANCSYIVKAPEVGMSQFALFSPICIFSNMRNYFKLKVAVFNFAQSLYSN